MPGSALEFRCHSHSLFGLLRVTAAKDITVVAEPEVRIRVQVPDNQKRKRRSELRVRKSWSAQSNFVCRQDHGRAESFCLSPRHEIMIVTSQWLDDNSVLMNPARMRITPKAIQNLLDELEASKQSRLRAWNVLQQLRSVLADQFVS